MRNLLIRMVSFLFAAVLPVMGVSPVTVSASADDVPTIESSYVLDDLQESTIDGRAFDLADYPYNSLLGKTKLISFAEYGFDDQTTENYRLFCYVYNPQKIDFDVESEKTVLNCLQFSVGDGEYRKYNLSYVNSSIGDQDGLFYKFKVSLTEAEKNAIYDDFSGERIYNVSGIELVREGYINADEYEVGKQYVYSGNMSYKNLSCRSSSIDTLSLDARHTVYRPEGTNGKDDYTQDSLHSVYFAVPKDVTGENGEMTAVHARWLDAVLKPQLVTGNEDVIAYFTTLLGRDIALSAEEDGYFLSSDQLLTRGENYAYFMDYEYNSPGMIDGCSVVPLKESFTDLYYIYNAGYGIDSADTHVVSSENILANVKDSADLYGGELVNGKYSKKIFSTVADDWTDITIRADDNFSLESQIITQSWWQKLWGQATVYKDTFDGIKAIQKLSDADFLSGDVDKICQELYISTADFTDLYVTYSLLKATHDIYLFRYQVSDYFSVEMYEYSMWKNWMGTWSSTEIDTNAYMFSETVNLDFDIIDIEITNDLGSTIIPVVMSPKDMVGGATPPVYTTSDVFPWWVWLIIAGVVLLVISFIRPLWDALWLVLKIAWYVVAWPVLLTILIVQKGRGG